MTDEIEERIAIKMDSGIPEDEAKRQALAEQRREPKEPIQMKLGGMCE